MSHETELREMGLNACASRRASAGGSQELLEMGVDDAARDALPPGIHAHDDDAPGSPRDQPID